MSHKSSTCWKESLNSAQRKYLLKHHGGFFKMFKVDVDSFSKSEMDDLMKRYQNDPEFNSLGSNISSINLNLKDLKL